MFFLLSGLTINKNESGQEWTYTYQGLYAYNHQTGQSGKIIDAEITSYAVDEEQEQIYYFAYADGLYVYDIKTERTRKLYDAGKEMGIAEMSYDGKYLYLYNGEWVSYAKSNEKQKLHGNVLFLQQTEMYYMNFRLTKRDICCLEMGIIFLPNRL